MTKNEKLSDALYQTVGGCEYASKVHVYRIRLASRELLPMTEGLTLFSINSSLQLAFFYQRYHR